MANEDLQIQEYVKGTVIRLMEKSKKYQTKIGEAKTNTKKKYFKKKLAKNNVRLAEVLQALQKIQTSEKQKDENETN